MPHLACVINQRGLTVGQTHLISWRRVVKGDRCSSNFYLAPYCVVLSWIFFLFHSL